MGFYLTKMSFLWTSTDYLCLKRMDGEGTVPEELSECSGAAGTVQESLTGVAENIHNFDIKIAAQDDTTLALFVEGAETATFKVHPEGDSAGNIEYSYAGGGKVLSARIAGAPREEFILSLRIRGLGAKTIGSVSA